MFWFKETKLSSGFFVFAVVSCIVICTGFFIAISLLRAAWAQKEREALTSGDLRALEESALLLIERLKSESDAAIEEIEKRTKKLSALLAEADARLSSLDMAKVAEIPAVVEEKVPTESYMQRVLALAAGGMECADIAKSLDMGCAEVNLILRCARTI